MEEYLEHFGTLGQRWGNRKYQYTDGSLTPLGRKHYGVGPPKGQGGGNQNGSKSSPSGSQKQAAQANKEQRERKKLIAQKKAEHRKQAKAERKARIAERKAAEKQKKIEKAKKKWENDPREVHKHTKYFTTEELEKLARRFEAENKIYQSAKNKRERGSEYINSFVKFGKALNGVDNLFGKPVKSKVKKYFKQQYGFDLDFGSEEKKKKND